MEAEWIKTDTFTLTLLWTRLQCRRGFAPPSSTSAPRVARSSLADLQRHRAPSASLPGESSCRSRAPLRTRSRATDTSRFCRRAPASLQENTGGQFD